MKPLELTSATLHCIVNESLIGRCNFMLKLLGSTLLYQNYLEILKYP